MLAPLSLTSCAQHPIALSLPSNGSSLLQLAKELADSGRLDDPVFVGRSLHTTLTEVSSDLHGVCGAANVEAVGRFTRYAPENEFWFHRLPSGTNFVVRLGPSPFQPGLTIEETPETPKIDYSISAIAPCDSSKQTGVKRSALLAFQSVPEFDCISLEEVKMVFPPQDRWFCVNDCPSFSYSSKHTSVQFWMAKASRPGPMAFCLAAIDLDQQEVRHDI